MNVGVLRERNAHDRRVVLAPPVVRQLAGRGCNVWVETGAGNGAMFRDDEYIGAGANIAYSPAEVIQRCELVVKISAPTRSEIELADRGTAIVAFYHLAVGGPAQVEALVARQVTAIGCEVIRTANGRLPVLAAGSEIAGQAVVPLAAHLLRSSSGGRGILLGGSPGVPPAHIVVLGAGAVGRCAARAAVAVGARVTVLDIDSEKLRRLMEHSPHVATSLADPDSIAAAVASADVVIGAVLVAGEKTPHVVTKPMVQSMRPGSVIIDVAIDQGGCIETSRPTTLADPTFAFNGVVHYCVPNLTADLGRSTSIAVGQALLPYLRCVAERGVDGALRTCAELAGGCYTYRGTFVRADLAATFGLPYRPLEEMLGGTGSYAMD